MIDDDVKMVIIYNKELWFTITIGKNKGITHNF